jgi:hypothetical protein
MPPSPLARLRKMALSLPEAHEVESWGLPTFRVKNKLFAMYAAGNTSAGAGRAGVWIKAPPGNQQLMLQFAPARFFYPPYVGKSGWIGVYLDSVCNWAELEQVLQDAWRMTAPKKLAAQLDDEPDAPPPPKKKKPHR